MCKLNLSTTLAILMAVLTLAFAASANDANSIQPSAESTAAKPAPDKDVTGVAIDDDLTGGPIGKPLPKPEPFKPAWTRIAPAETHIMQVPISGWTIFSLMAWEDSVINALILDADWNVVAEFDSTGCGAFLQIDAQLVTVVIHNNSRLVSNEYLLYIVDVN